MIYSDAVSYKPIGRPDNWFDIEVEKVFTIEDKASAAIQNFGNSARILTRFYVVPEHRVKTMKRPPIESEYFVKKSIEYCKDKFDHVFVSFEGDMAPALAKKMCSILNSYSDGWEVLPYRYKTCNSFDPLIRFQKIIIKRFNDNEFTLRTFKVKL